MAECIKGEEGTLACSSDPIPTNIIAPDTTLVDSIRTAMCDAAYTEINGMTGSVNLTSQLNEVVIPLLDFAGAEARCVTNKDFSVTFQGIACPGDPGYDCLYQHFQDCTEAFFRYRWLGDGAGLPDIYGTGFVNLNLTNAVDDIAQWSSTVNFRIDKNTVQ